MNQRPRLLFCVVGVGAGNTTRNLAIIAEVLRIRECEIRIAAQGNARRLLEKHYHTIPLRDVGYTSSGNFSLFQIVKSNLSFPVKFWQNMSQLRGIMENFQPDLVIADSDFYCLRPAKKLGLKLASINNSAVIVESIRQDGGLPRGCGFSYNFIEKTDYWLQRRYPDRILCPTIRPISGLAPKFVQIPPMVRPEIVAPKNPGDEIVVLTGGSGIDAGNIDLRALEGEKITILGSRVEKAPASANQVGFTLDVAAHFARAKVLVVQGGFSSVSEAVALRLPTVVLPIRNHAEQWANARAVERLGMGLMAPDPSLAGETIKKLLASYDQFLTAARAVDVPTDGHRVAAEKIVEWATTEAL